MTRAKLHVKITTSKWRLGVVKAIIACTTQLYVICLITDDDVEHIIDWTAKFFVNGVKIREM